MTLSMKDTAHSLDEKAKGLAVNYLRTEGELLCLLVQMRQQKVFAELNYSGIFDYCEKALKLSSAQAFYFKTVAEKSEEVPQIKKAVAQGELTLSQARRIVPVVTQENHEQWIAKAKSLPQRELEREVTAVNPKARVQEKIRPVALELSELKVAIDRKTEDNLSALKDILSQKLGKAATLADVISWLAQEMREKCDPVKRAERGKGKADSEKRKESVSLGNTKRQKIRAGVKHQVVRRDGMQCTFVSQDGRRCEAVRWLHLHHVVPVERGGQNSAENLKFLCSAHHRWVHLKREIHNDASTPSVRYKGSASFPNPW